MMLKGKGEKHVDKRTVKGDESGGRNAKGVGGWGRNVCILYLT
jgi:hypothetical protein